MNMHQFLQLSAPPFKKGHKDKKDNIVLQKIPTARRSLLAGRRIPKRTPLFPRSLYNNLPDLLNDCIIEDASDREQDISSFPISQR